MSYDLQHKFTFSGKSLLMTVHAKLDDAPAKTRVHTINTDQAEFQKAMIGMGWVPPLATAHALTDELEIDRICARIAGSEPTSPMISYAGDGVLRVGGQINLEQAVAIVALLTKVKV